MIGRAIMIKIAIMIESNNDRASNNNRKSNNDRERNNDKESNNERVLENNNDKKNNNDRKNNYYRKGNIVIMIEKRTNTKIMEKSNYFCYFDRKSYCIESKRKRDLGSEFMMLAFIESFIKLGHKLTFGFELIMVLMINFYMQFDSHLLI